MNFLSLKDVSKSYRQAGQTIQVLTNLNLDVKKAETIAILGQSGSGKSTLLSLLAGLDKPEKGQITINEKAIHNMDEGTLSKFRGKTMGIVFQHFHLMKHLTAWENVALPLRIADQDGAQESASEALKMVALDHRQEHYPYQLSGGEQQRVAIARAFVTKPALILADEPSGNLDQETGNQVMDMLFDMIKEQDMTLILVTHNPALAEQCHRKLSLKSGQLVEGL
ncbi:MAG: ABC transporter ATP-binding protein [Oligoflexales bacterium]|nr:ABC transporter ATP-binding protein [Oligoflexales bacterium]